VTEGVLLVLSELFENAEELQKNGGQAHILKQKVLATVTLHSKYTRALAFENSGDTLKICTHSQKKSLL
jgi:hypothetical protein